MEITVECAHYSSVKVTLRERIINIGEREGVDVAIQKEGGFCYGQRIHPNSTLP
jgi:hypothetical protein